MKVLLSAASCSVLCLGLVRAEPQCVGPGAVVRMEVKGVPGTEDMNGDYLIGEDGMVTGLPYLRGDPVKATGLTEDQLARAILDAYRKADIFSKGAITVRARKPGDPLPQAVLVSGRVVHSGSIPFKDRLTVKEAIKAAGGPDRYGSLYRVILYRRGQPKQKLDLKQAQAKATALAAGDAIEVPLRIGATALSEERGGIE